MKMGKRLDWINLMEGLQGNMFLLWKKITELLAVLMFRILTVDTLKDLF